MTVIDGTLPRRVRRSPTENRKRDASASRAGEREATVAAFHVPDS
jgi:hypothetical protein